MRKWNKNTVVLLMASIFFTMGTTLIIVLPIFTREGDFFGYYRFRHMLVGIPLLFLTFSLWSILLAGPRQRKQRIFKLLAMFGSIIITYSISEAFTILLTHHCRHSEWSKWNLPDPELGYIRRPHIQWRGKPFEGGFVKEVTYRTDENGFRNPPSIESADIVFIGDSFVEAGGVQEKDTFVQLVADSLNVTAVNLSIGGYGPQQELIVLERYAFRYASKLIIWVLFEGNDLLNALEYLEYMKLFSSLSTREKAYGVFVGENNQRLECLFDASIAYRVLKHFKVEKNSIRTNGLWGIFKAKDERVYTIQIADEYPPSEVFHNAVGWEETQKSIVQGQELCRKRDIHLLIVFIPTKLRVMGPYSSFDSTKKLQKYLAGDKWDRDDDFESAVTKLCNNSQIEFLNAKDALRNAAKMGELVYVLQNDSHLDIAGHSVVANLIVQQMKPHFKD